MPIDPREALTYLTRAEQLQPKSPEVHLNLGTSALKLGRVSEAVKEYQEALEIKPKYAEAHSNLGSAF